MQIYEVEEKPFTSSLNIQYIQKPTVERGGGGRNNAFPPLPYIDGESVNI